MGLQPGKQQEPQSSSVFQTCVVWDYIGNPVEYFAETSLYDTDLTNEESLKAGTMRIINKDVIDPISIVPRNSILAAVGKDTGYEILFPFFSEHLCLPLKAGELVWVIRDSSPSAGPSQGYWLSRKSGILQVNDLNYTHIDRTKTINKILNPSGESSGGSKVGTVSVDGTTGESPTDTLKPYSFPPGGGTTSAGNRIEGGVEAYDTVVNKSLSYTTQFTGEPVPRFSKRSPDLTLQGSNNTLICLGEDRGIGAGSSEGGLSTDTSVKGKGAIDIVAGRSAFLSDDTAIASEEGGINLSDNPTSPAAIVKNSRGNNRDYTEVDKTPDINKDDKDNDSDINGDNTAEGDPDFINDLSRVYLSMKTSGDENFGIEITNIGSSSENSDTDTDAKSDEPYAVIKSTNPRIIAKEDGSIKIVHESGSSIVMDSSGNIQIQGASVSIGSATADQPYIRYDEWETVMQNVISDLNGLATDIAAIGGLLLSMGTTSASSGPVAGPLAAWAGVLGSITACYTNSNAIIGATSGDNVGGTAITTVKSSIISGE